MIEEVVEDGVVAGAVAPAGVAGSVDPSAVVDGPLIEDLGARARTQGPELSGPNGLLAALTKRVLESALEGEITDHLGYARHEAAGHGSGSFRNGVRATTVLTDVGPVEIEVPRDRDASFTPHIVAKRQRRLSGVEDLVLSLSAKGLTHGEISAHLAEVYGTSVSKMTITTITEKVMAGMSQGCEPAAGPRLPGRLRRRDQREDPGRAGRQPAHLRRPGGHRRGPPRPVGRSCSACHCRAAIAFSCSLTCSLSGQSSVSIPVEYRAR
jgi:hypothetical protein